MGHFAFLCFATLSFQGGFCCDAPGGKVKFRKKRGWRAQEGGGEEVLLFLIHNPPDVHRARRCHISFDAFLCNCPGDSQFLRTPSFFSRYFPAPQRISLPWGEQKSTNTTVGCTLPKEHKFIKNMLFFISSPTAPRGWQSQSSEILGSTLRVL